MKEIFGEKYYSVSDVAEELEVTANTVYYYINNNHLKAKKIGGRIYISEQQLRDFVEDYDTNEFECLECETINPENAKFCINCGCEFENDE